MPTDYDWRKAREEQRKAEQPPEDDQPPALGSMMLYTFFLSLIISGSFWFWNFTQDAADTLKIIDHCIDIKGVPIKTIRGDAVCIKQDALAEVLKGKD